MRTSRLVAYAGTIVFTVGLACQAAAEPVLQLYLEGADYDETTESWLLHGASAQSTTIRLWAIGNTSKGDIEGVRLSAVYDGGEFPDISISLTPTVIGGDGSYLGFLDPSQSTQAVYLQTVTDGSVPILGDGGPLPPHGVYQSDGIFGPDYHWQEFALGNFTLQDSFIGDFTEDAPTPSKTKGQINAYDVTVYSAAGTHGVMLHFDLYNHVEGSTHAKFAPFSHDGDGDLIATPAPSSLVGLASLGLAAAAIAWWRKPSGN